MAPSARPAATDIYNTALRFEQTLNNSQLKKTYLRRSVEMVRTIFYVCIFNMLYVYDIILFGILLVLENIYTLTTVAYV